MNREFEQHCCEPVNANVLEGTLAGEDGKFPQHPPNYFKDQVKKVGYFIDCMQIGKKAITLPCNSLFFGR